MKSSTSQQRELSGITVPNTELKPIVSKLQSSILFLLLFCTCPAITQDFDIYVSDAAGFNNPPWKILKFDNNGANPEVFINTNLGWPQDILFLEDQGVVLISNLTTNRINKHNAETGAYEGIFASGISGPTRIKIGADNLLYVLQWSGNGRVRRYELDGTFVDEFTNLGVSQSIGLDWDVGGNLYVSSYSDDSVRKFDTEGNDQGLFINSNLSGPTNIWFDDNGDLLVVDYDGTAVKRFDSDGNYLGDFLQGLSNAEGVAYLPNGNILIGNGGNSAVKLFSPTGTYISDFISSGSGNLITPNAVVVRDLNAVNTDEPEALSQLQLAPTIGTTFYLESANDLRMEQIRVFSADGRLMTIIRPFATTTSWQAHAYADGLYLLEVYLTDGSQSMVKVVVQH